jgi:hypothetical protein
MDQFVEITYRPEAEKMTIQVDVTSMPGILKLVANKHGMAYLAGLAADFVTFLNPQEHEYEVGPEQGLLPGSPTLFFAFDPALDDLEPDNSP